MNFIIETSNSDYFRVNFANFLILLISFFLIFAIKDAFNNKIFIADIQYVVIITNINTVLKRNFE